MAGFHLGLGLDFVDRDRYGGWDGRLNACVKDARAMAGIAEARGFENRQLLLNGDATAKNVQDALLDLAGNRAIAGDLVLVTYSGHGGQLPDTDSDELTGQDSTLVLFDRQFLDDEVAACLARFREGVRVVFISDSCHSGTVTRDILPAAVRQMPAAIVRPAYLEHEELYEALREKDVSGILAPVIALSACRDDQVALDGHDNGAFTENLLAVYGSEFKGSHFQFHNEIVARMRGRGLVQIPQIDFPGGYSAAFQHQDPFTPEKP